jgi:inhibitor of KinA sporulation pathway (predicted exonuclease)
MPHWLVIDLEATTDEGGWPVTEMEIIEIGASLVDRRSRAGSLSALRQTDPASVADAVLPELTHITQANIDAAQPLTRSGRVRALARPAPDAP